MEAQTKYTASFQSNLGLYINHEDVLQTWNPLYPYQSMNGLPTGQNRITALDIRAQETL